MLTDSTGQLSGVFTDSDLARRLETGDPSFLEQPVAMAMSKGVRVVAHGCLLTDVVEHLTTAKISELPVVDSDNCPLGIVDVTDVVSLLGETKPTNGDLSENSLESPDADVPRIIPIHRSC